MSSSIVTCAHINLSCFTGMCEFHHVGGGVLHGAQHSGDPTGCTMVETRSGTRAAEGSYPTYIR